MAKQTMKYFELSNGQKIDIDKDSLNSSKFGTYTSSNYGKGVDTNLTLPTNANEYAFLKGNPFLISWNRTNEDYKNYTLDEFIIRYKNQDYRYGEFINSKRISKGKKKSVTKQVFKKWDAEFKANYNSAVETSHSTFSVANQLYYEKKPFVAFITMLVIGVLVGILVLMPQSIFSSLDAMVNSNIFTNFYNRMVHIYITYPITIAASGCALLFIVLYLIAHLAHNGYCTGAKDFTKNNIEWLKNTNSKIAKQYRKNFQKARKYYLKNINSKCRPFAPYSLNKITMKTNVDAIDKLNVIVVEKTHYYDTNVNRSRKFANLMMAFTIIMLIVYVALIVYNMFCR